MTESTCVLSTVVTRGVTAVGSGVVAGLEAATEAEVTAPASSVEEEGPSDVSRVVESDAVAGAIVVENAVVAA